MIFIRTFMNKQCYALAMSSLIIMGASHASDASLRRYRIIGSGIGYKMAYAAPKDRPFSKIRAAGPGSLNIIGGSSNTLTIAADTNLFRKPFFLLKEGELSIELETKSAIQPKIPISYTLQLCPAALKLLTSITTSMDTVIKTPIAAKNLTISVTGANTFTAEEDLKIDEELSLQHYGSNSVTLAHIAARHVTLNHSGSGFLTIAKGRAGFGLFNIKYFVFASDLIIDTLMLDISKCGSLSCTVQNLVSGSLSGIGQFRNYGPGDASRLVISQPARYVDEYKRNKKTS